MRQHADEQEHHEQKAAPGRIGPARDVTRAENPGEEEEESDVDSDGCSGDGAELQVPRHGLPHNGRASGQGQDEVAVLLLR
ncbi:MULTISPECIES: hypothetical protein [unclassified Bradyrhizobium]